MTMTVNEAAMAEVLAQGIKPEGIRICVQMWGQAQGHGLLAVDVLRAMASLGLVTFKAREEDKNTGTSWVVYKVTAKGFKKLEQYNSGATVTLMGEAANTPGIRR